MSSDQDLIAVCSECKSDNPDSYVENNPFYKQGGAIPCKFCGGILIITERGNRENALRRMDTQRAIGHDPMKKQ